MWGQFVTLKFPNMGMFAAYKMAIPFAWLDWLFMSVAVKAAAFGSLARILVTVLSTRSELWADLLWGLAALTMMIGNVMAVRQTSVKRMLAYSSIAHTGYALAGLAAMRAVDGSFNADGASAVVFYVLSYTFMTLGAFLFLVFVGHTATATGSEPEWQDGETLDDLAGLAFRRPWAAVAMAAARQRGRPLSAMSRIHDCA
jgi:NADH:ubiquinone oxidoreductase subunit 2 (subunit N)